MKSKWLRAALLVLVAAASPALAKSVTGTWEWSGGPEASGAWLKLVQDGCDVRFQLEISRGAPSHNSGFVEGVFVLERNVGTFRSSEDGGCEITFSFSGRKVRLHQDFEKGSCGFGHGVHAMQELKRRSRHAPILTDGDPRLGGTCEPVPGDMGQPGPAQSVAQVEATSVARMKVTPNVPHVPFGQVNAEWLAFKARMRPGDTIHAFRTDIQVGYLVLRQSCFVGAFLEWAR